MWYIFLFVISGGKTPDVGSRMYSQIMREQMLKGEESEVSEILICILIIL